MIFGIVYSILGLVIIVSGIRVIVTGSFSAREEERIAHFSEKAARTYKLVSSIVYIILGIGMIGLSVVRILEEQKILTDKLPFTIALIVLFVICGGVLGITWFRCKKESEKDGEK